MDDRPTTRIAAFQAFERRFRKPRFYPSPPPPIPVGAEEVLAAERELQCHLPASYHEFVSLVGPCEVRGLCDAWLYRGNRDERCPPPFETFWSPASIVKQCGMPWLAPIPAQLAGGSPVASAVAWKYLLPFASDECGSWHCFPRTSDMADDLPVYYFDHDGGDIEQVAVGLEDLVRTFLRLAAIY